MPEGRADRQGPTRVQALGARLHLGGRSVDEAVAAAQVACGGGRHAVHPSLRRRRRDLGPGRTSGSSCSVRCPTSRASTVGGRRVPSAGSRWRSGRQRAGGGGDRRPGRGVRSVRRLDQGRPRQVPVDSVRTIADGIAVKRPGELTLKLIEHWVKDLVCVGEDQVAEAMVFLMERSKLVVEGAGAVGVAALLGRQAPGSDRRHHGARAVRWRRRRRTAGGGRSPSRDTGRTPACAARADPRSSGQPGGAAGDDQLDRGEPAGRPAPSRGP